MYPKNGYTNATPTNIPVYEEVITQSIDLVIWKSNINNRLIGLFSLKHQFFCFFNVSISF
jgi:hypothetical protein